MEGARNADLENSAFRHTVYVEASRFRILELPNSRQSLRPSQSTQSSSKLYEYPRAPST